MNDQLARMAACLGPFPKELTTNVVTAELLFDRNNNQHNRNIVTGEQLFNPDGTSQTRVQSNPLIAVPSLISSDVPCRCRISQVQDII